MSAWQFWLGVAAILAVALMLGAAVTVAIYAIGGCSL